MKSILIPVEESELLESVLESALLVARRFGSHMEGLHVRPDFAGIIAATGMGAPYVVEDFRKEDWDSIQRSRTEFERFLNRNDVPLDGGAGTGQPWATFRIEAPPGDDFIGPCPAVRSYRAGPAVTGRHAAAHEHAGSGAVRRWQAGSGGTADGAETAGTHSDDRLERQHRNGQDSSFRPHLP